MQINLFEHQSDIRNLWKSLEAIETQPTDKEKSKKLISYEEDLSRWASECLDESVLAEFNELQREINNQFERAKRFDPVDLTMQLGEIIDKLKRRAGLSSRFCTCSLRWCLVAIDITKLKMSEGFISDRDEANTIIKKLGKKAYIMHSLLNEIG